MGRTIPSFRIASIMEEKEWKPFRNLLDKSDRKMPIFMSIIFHHYKQLIQLTEQQIKAEEKH
ncbi:MAG: hypothetical protein K0S91_3189 [Nitrososphaeraceae archaeon]|nr:hypothetical protein [Nitrososphaeraceae archaeon]